MIGNTHRILVSEILLCVFLVALLTLDASPRLTKIANILGMGFALATFVETLIRTPYSWFRPLIPMGTLLVLVWLALVMNPSGIKVALTFTQIFVLLVCVYLTVRRTHRTWPLELGFAIGVFIIWHTQGASFTELKGMKSERLTFTLRGDEAGLNANLYGLYLIMAVLFSVKLLLVDNHTARQHWSWWGRMPLAIATILISVQQIIMVTGSRKAQLMLFIVIAAASLIYLKGGGKVKIGRVLIGSVAGVMILFVVWNQLKGSDHFQRLESLAEMATTGNTKENSAETRLEMYQTGVALWARSPVFGWGTDSFRVKGGFGTYSHSNIIELLANYGIIGLALYYWLHLVAWQKALRCSRSSQIPVLKPALWVLAGLATTTLLFDPFAVCYTGKVTAIYLGTFLGVACVLKPNRVSKTALIAK